MKRLKDFVGADLTRIAIPVFFNEPTSFLHRACEACEAYELLHSAASAAADDAGHVLRLAHLAAFSIAAYSTGERTSKPFNPLLGETFEFSTASMRFVAEQVSHHPPITAGHMEGADWEWWQTKEFKASFTGNAVNSPPAGLTSVRFKKDDVVYEWGGLSSTIHNILVGRLWLDHYGKYTLAPSKPGFASAEVEFTQCGWFSRGWHKVLALIKDAKGTPRLYVGGFWHEVLEMWDVAHGSDYAKVPDAAKTVLWRKPPPPANPKWRGFGSFIEQCCELTDQLKSTLPRSDARFRPDILELAKGNYRLAGAEKWKLEEKQRAERKLREEGTIGDWQQRWFSLQNKQWIFGGKYWTARAERLAAAGLEAFGPKF
jgi:oxysterol-binding protein 1